MLQEQQNAAGYRCYKMSDVDTLKAQIDANGGRRPVTQESLRNRKQPIGRSFGHLIIKELATPPEEPRRKYRCECRCGKEVVAYLGSIKKGYVVSCGGPSCLAPSKEYKRRGRPKGALNKDKVAGVVLREPGKRPVGRPVTGRKPRDPRAVAKARSTGDKSAWPYLDKLSGAYSKVGREKVHAWLEEKCKAEGKDYNLVVLKLREGSFDVKLDGHGKDW